MQAPKFVCGKTPTLLLEIPIITPARHARICPLLGRHIRERGIGREVGAIPGKIHAGILPTSACLHQIVKRNAGRVADTGVAGDPGQGVSTGRVRCQGLEEIVVSIAVNFVEADVGIRLAVRGCYVPYRQDLHPTPTISAYDLFRPRLKLPSNDRIGGDKLLCQVEIVGGLAFVIGQHKAVVTVRGKPDQKPIEASKDQVGRLPILFRPADREIELRAVAVKGVEHTLENDPPVEFDSVEQWTSIQAPQLREEIQWVRRVDHATGSALSTSAKVDSRPALPSSPISRRARTNEFENAR
jgi:hypothetical protein